MNLVRIPNEPTGPGPSLGSKILPLRDPSLQRSAPESSVGAKRGVIKKLQFWDVSGPALEKANRLKPTISTLLNEHNKCHTFRTLKSSFATLFEVFMVAKIGTPSESACPALVIICPITKLSEEIGKVIHRSKVLESYPGFKFLASKQDPRLPPDGPGGPQVVAYGDEPG